jgi:cellulose synthase/poly-beta-1,6-N-acetylglucosamine synthase-like glycosyltransferase
MKKSKQTQVTPQFLDIYKRNFYSFLEALLSVLPVILLTVCGVCFGIFIFNQNPKYLAIFLATLIVAPLLQTIAERLEAFFERKTWY